MKTLGRSLLALSCGGLLLLSSLAGCDAEKGDAAPAQAAAVEAAAGQAAPAQVAPEQAASGQAQAGQAVPAQAAAPQVDAADAGTSQMGGVDRTRFPDPAWFNAGVLPLSQVKHQGHTEPDSDGFFASNLTLETEVDLDAAKCIEALQHQIGSSVPSWEAGEEAEGRITIRGQGDRYAVTLVCGKVKGKTTASVNYRWTK